MIFLANATIKFVHDYVACIVLTSTVMRNFLRISFEVILSISGTLLKTATGSI